jgi:hypothetical protein
MNVYTAPGFVIDLSSTQREYIIEVPYHATTETLATYYKPTVTNDRRSIMGTIAIYAKAPLVVNAMNPTTVDYRVGIAMGDDFELYNVLPTNSYFITQAKTITISNHDKTCPIPYRDRFLTLKHFFTSFHTIGRHLLGSSGQTPGFITWALGSQTFPSVFPFLNFYSGWAGSLRVRLRFLNTTSLALATVDVNGPFPSSDNAGETNMQQLYLQDLGACASGYPAKSFKSNATSNNTAIVTGFNTIGDGTTLATRSGAALDRTIYIHPDDRECTIEVPYQGIARWNTTYLQDATTWNFRIATYVTSNNPPNIVVQVPVEVSIAFGDDFRAIGFRPNYRNTIQPFLKAVGGVKYPEPPLRDYVVTA